MVKRFFRRKARSYTTAFRKHYRGSSSGGMSPMKMGISAAAYGAFRDKIHSFIPDVGVPYSDSLITGALGYYMATKSKGWMKNAGYAVLAVEAAAVGKALIGGSGVSSSGAGNNAYVAQLNNQIY